MDGPGPDNGISPMLARLGLRPGPAVAVQGGPRLDLWLAAGEPAVAVLADGGDDGDGLCRLARSTGCRLVLVPAPDGPRLIDCERGGRSMRLRTAAELAERLACANHAAPVPAVVATLERLTEAWREGELRRRLADRHDWTEESLNLAVEAPIADALLDGALTPGMEADLDRAGVVLSAVPPGLLAWAWDRHLGRRVHLRGGSAEVRERPPLHAGADRVALRVFARWAATEPGEVRSVLVPACGAGRLLLLTAGWAMTNNIQLYGLDPDPRAVLFASRLLERAYGGGLRFTVRAGHPLVEDDIYDDPLARLIPEDARARLRAADWSGLFDGVKCFDRVMIGDPVLPLTRRTSVRRYLEGRYATARTGTDPALVLVEAGARRLSPGGRVFALYRLAAYRAGSAAAVRRWLAPRVDAMVDVGSSSGARYCAVSASAYPVDGPIRAGRFTREGPILRPHPRRAFDQGSWNVTDPAAITRRRRLELGAAPLGEILLGGVRPPDPAAPALSGPIGAADRHRLIRADRRAARVIRPFVPPEAIVPFGSALAAPRYAITAPLPPRARRQAIELGLDPTPTALPVADAGPRLLFAEGARTPAFLWDRDGRAVPGPGVGTIAPGDPFLVGLLHAAPMADLIAVRCPDGLTARCLARLPVRLPDPYDEQERRTGEEIAALALERVALTEKGGAEAAASRSQLESAIDRAVQRLYRMPSP